VGVNEKMNDKCIGIENKDKIQSLTNEVNLLKQEVKHMKGSMMTIETFHKMQTEISEIKFKLKNMEENRTEDRETLSKLSEIIEGVRTNIEEYLKGNAEVLANQIISQKEQESLKESIELILNEMKRMNIEIKNNNIWSQIKVFYGKSKFNRWVCRFVGLMLIILTVSIFSFFTSGGNTFFEILKNLKELII